jgi:class 3 adenylate cyclase
MYCDLVSYTRFFTESGPEGMSEIMRLYQETCTEVLHQYDGHIARNPGDGLLVYFGYPVAHEDDAQRAVQAGLGVIEALRHLNHRLSHPLQVRIGIHRGLVASAGEERSLLEKAINLTERLQSRAAPDTVVISGTIYQQIQGQFACQDLGPQMLKGVSNPVSMYRVLGPTSPWEKNFMAVKQGPVIGGGYSRPRSLIVYNSPAYSLVALFSAILVTVVIFTKDQFPSLLPFLGTVGGVQAGLFLINEARITKRGTLSKLCFYAAGFVLLFETASLVVASLYR